jgi:hypothetical protein
VLLRSAWLHKSRATLKEQEPTLRSLQVRNSVFMYSVVIRSKITCSIVTSFFVGKCYFPHWQTVTMKHLWKCSYVCVWFSHEGSASSIWQQLCFVEDIDKIFNSFHSVKHTALDKTLLCTRHGNSPHVDHWTASLVDNQ